MNISIVQDQLLKVLDGSQAHISFDKTVEGFPGDTINTRIAQVPYSAWELVTHMYLAQHDILDFIVNADYREPKWPDDYWPDKEQQATIAEWQQTIEKFRGDLQALKDIVLDVHTDFTAELAHAPGYTIFREILIVGNHNSYHTGQLLVLKRSLGAY